MRGGCWALLPVVCCLVSCSGGSGKDLPQEYRVIYVDEAHAMGKETDPPPYVIGPGIGLVLDARGFDFASTPSPGVKPNAVHLVIGEDKMYTAAWDPSNVVNLYSKTLEPLADSRPFEGLCEDETAVMVIGKQSFDEKEQAVVLEVLWSGIIKVMAGGSSGIQDR